MKITFEVECETANGYPPDPPRKVWVLKWDQRDYREITATDERFVAALSKLLRLAADELDRDFPQFGRVTQLLNQR